MRGRMNGKIVVYNNCFKLAVIANQSADWCGNPPDEWNQVTITSKKRGFPELVGACRNIVRLTGGLPRQCAHWLAMTAFFESTSTNTNLSYC